MKLYYDFKLNRKNFRKGIIKDNTVYVASEKYTSKRRIYRANILSKFEDYYTFNMNLKRDSKIRTKCFLKGQIFGCENENILRVLFIISIVHQIRLWCQFYTAITLSKYMRNSWLNSVFLFRKSLNQLPRFGVTPLLTILLIVCTETILLSTTSSCAKTFYMHWNTSNSIFRIDNTDHIIDVNKGNLAFEFDQVHIICPVYEPGAFENETEKYIIYNVSKVEYETCRITNADPRVIAICDKPQKLMFFTITFRPFTPQPGGLEFLPGHDYYFISTSSKDDLYRRIGGRCSTNNMKVVFKVCCGRERIIANTSYLDETSVAPRISINNTSTVDYNLSANVNFNNIQTTRKNNAINSEGVIRITSNGSTNNIEKISINTENNAFNRKAMHSNSINFFGNTIDNGFGSFDNNRPFLTNINHNNVNVMSFGEFPTQVHREQNGIRINNVPSSHYTNSKNNDDNIGKLSNEVVKNEELTYNSGSIMSRTFLNQLFTTLLNYKWMSLFSYGRKADEITSHSLSFCLYFYKTMYDIYLNLNSVLLFIALKNILINLMFNNRIVLIRKKLIKSKMPINNIAFIQNLSEKNSQNNFQNAPRSNR